MDLHSYYPVWNDRVPVVCPVTRADALPVPACHCDYMYNYRICGRLGNILPGKILGKCWEWKKMLIKKDKKQMPLVSAFLHTIWISHKRLRLFPG